jgi:hypothetical protein
MDKLLIAELDASKVSMVPHYGHLCPPHASDLAILHIVLCERCFVKKKSLQVHSPAVF